MKNSEYVKLVNNLRKTPISKKINDSCVFANVDNECECSALKENYCNNCNFYKSKDEYYLDDGGFCHRKEV